MTHAIISIMFANIPEVCKSEMQSLVGIIPNAAGGFYTAHEQLMDYTEKDAEDALIRQLEIITNNDILFRKYSNLGGKITLYITLGRDGNGDNNNSVLFSPAILAILSKYRIQVGVDG